jgi:hypothetical protein
MLQQWCLPWLLQCNEVPALCRPLPPLHVVPANNQSHQAWGGTHTQRTYLQDCTENSTTLWRWNNKNECSHNLMNLQNTQNMHACTHMQNQEFNNKHLKQRMHRNRTQHDQWKVQKTQGRYYFYAQTLLIPVQVSTNFLTGSIITRIDFISSSAARMSISCFDSIVRF